MDVSVTDPAPAPVSAPVDPVASPTPSVSPNDPFYVDESKFSSFTPEQRASLNPVLTELKTKAEQEWTKRQKSIEEKYKPHQDKAEALDNLVKRPEFQQWWVNQQQALSQGQSRQTQNAIAAVKPQDFASGEEWSQAVIEASNGDPAKLQNIQARMFSAMATPVVQKLQEEQQALKSTLAMKDLFERHQDAKDLDMIGRASADDKTPSLLEIALDYAVEKQGKSMEEGYALARKWADALGMKAKQEAMGLVQEKKEASTAGPSTSQASQAVVEVDSMDELVRRNLEALSKGEKPPKFVVKHK